MYCFVEAANDEFLLKEANLRGYVPELLRKESIVAIVTSKSVNTKSKRNKCVH